MEVLPDTCQDKVKHRSKWELREAIICLVGCSEITEQNPVHKDIVHMPKLDRGRPCDDQLYLPAGFDVSRGLFSLSIDEIEKANAEETRH